MGSVRNLGNTEINTHLLLTSSNLAELYIYDILKAKCKADRECIYNIETKKDITNMLELVNVQSYLSDKWLFILPYRKVKSILKEHKGIFESDTSEFLILVKNYKEYKEVKEILSTVNDIYLAYIRNLDVEYLLRDYKLSDKLVSFVAKSYASTPEQVFVLMRELDNGAVVETRKHISDICGVSVGTLNYFVMSLLKNPPTTTKGKQMVCRNRMKVAIELSETYGFSKMRNFLLACVKDILDIKMLYMNGVIYDKIRDLPEIEVENIKGEKVPVFDTKRLSRYNMFLNTIIETPYPRIARLYLTLSKCGKWYRSLDLSNFIYTYYKEGDVI